VNGYTLHGERMTEKSSLPEESFDLMRNDLLLRWQRVLRIAPPTGLGVARRAIFFAMLTWLPIVVWAAINQRLLDDLGNGEPLLRHFGIHVRFLIAIPLFIVAEAMAGKILNRIVNQFSRSGIIGDLQQPAFAAAIARVARFRDSSLPWVAVVGIAWSWAIGAPVHTDSHDLSWAAADAGLGFGGWWLLYVARPIFMVLLFGWIWRIFLIILLFFYIVRLELSLSPAHPDRVGGLGFLEKLPMALFPVTMAISAIVASRWMHDELYHGLKLAELKAPFAVFVVVWCLIVLSPLLMFVPRILAMKREALLEYGALLSQHGRLVQRRWILGENFSSDNATGHDILDAPELGPVVDISAIYDAVKSIRPAPISKSSVMMVIVPILLPMMFVITHEIPLKDLLLKLLNTVV